MQRDYLHVTASLPQGYLIVKDIKIAGSFSNQKFSSNKK
jgi:hypothetical protein